MNRIERPRDLRPISSFKTSIHKEILRVLYYSMPKFAGSLRPTPGLGKGRSFRNGSDSHRTLPDCSGDYHSSCFHPGQIMTFFLCKNHFLLCRIHLLVSGDEIVSRSSWRNLLFPFLTGSCRRALGLIQPGLRCCLLLSLPPCLSLASIHNTPALQYH